MVFVPLEMAVYSLDSTLLRLRINYDVRTVKNFKHTISCDPCFTYLSFLQWYGNGIILVPLITKSTVKDMCWNPF